MNIIFLTLLDFKSFNEQNIYCDLLREFKKRGHEVYCISPTERRNGIETHLEEDGYLLKLRIGNTQKTNIVEKGISTLMIEGQFVSAIKKYFRNVKFDLVLYSTPPITLGKAVNYIKKRDNAKTYLMLKDIFPQNALDLGMMTDEGVFGLVYRYFRRKESKLYDMSDYIGCMSQANAEYVLQHNPELDSERVMLCPNCIEVVDKSVDTKARENIRNKYGIPIDKKVFVYGGNLGKPQGIPFIIECLKAQENNESAYFLIVGDGTEFDVLEEYLESSGATNMKLMRRLPKEDYDTVVASCDVGMIFLDHRFTIPNFPSRILSYMQARLPVLALTDPNTDVGDVIVNGEFGWWYESNDTNGFDAAVKLATESDTESIGNNAFDYLCENYSADKICDDIIVTVKDKPRKPFSEKPKKEKIKSFFFAKDGSNEHSAFYKILIFLLIFTSGMGTVGSFLGIRPSYIVAFTVAVMIVIEKIRSLYITSNKYYLAFMVFMLAWGAYALCQGAFIQDTSLYGVYLKILFINIFLVFVIIDYVRDAKDVRFLLYCFASYIAVCIFIGLFEIISDIHLVNVRDASHWLPHSFYGNENDNAAVLVYGVCAILLCLSEAPPQRIKRIFTIMLAVTIFETVMTNSRAAILGLAVLAVFTALFSCLVWISRHQSIRLYRTVILSAVALFVLLIVMIFTIFTPDELIEMLSSEGNEESDSFRFNIIFSSIRAVFETYGLGLGAGQSITLNNINLHNLYLEIFADYGAIIGGVFCAFMLGIMFDLKGSAKNERSILTEGFIRSFPIVLAIVGIGPSSALSLRATWIIISIIFALKYVNEDGNKTPQSVSENYNEQ